MIVASTYAPLLVFFGLRMTTKPGGLAAAFLSIAITVAARLGTGLLYAVNPFAFECLFAGQLCIVLGYAVVPRTVGALLEAASNRRHIPHPAL